MAEIDDLNDWITSNAGTAKGTPEFVQKAQRYRELRTQELGGASPGSTPTPSAAPAPTTADLTPAGISQSLRDKVSGFTRQAAEKTAANPGGVDATTGRILTGAVGGVRQASGSGWVWRLGWRCFPYWC